MKFPEPLEPVIFLRRYKRFLADVRRADGTEITVHCANTGSMKGCQPPNAPAWISDSKNPKRKLRYSLEIIEIDGAATGVNTARPNGIVEEGLRAGVVPSLAGFDQLRREVRYGSEGSRVDIELMFGEQRCYVEVKSVTMGVGDGVCRFPDAVTTRGTKHLRELMAMVALGHRAVLFFCASRSDTQIVEPADDIDPTYGRTLREAMAAGVEVLAHRCEVTEYGIWLREAVDVRIPLMTDASCCPPR